MRPKPIRAPDQAKRLGAFYTPPEIASKLADWSIRSSSDRVLDPSFGGLAFLAAASRRLESLGASQGAASRQIFGAELDSVAYSSAKSQTAVSISHKNLWDADFFAFQPGPLIPHCTAVIGNPPYIRYQGFNEAGDTGHRLAAEAGIKLSRLASSWAPFLIHATSFVEPGGRLAQVLPAELLHAQYASEILSFLSHNFSTVTVVSFEERVFPGALEEVVLLLADNKEAPQEAGVEMIACETVADFDAGVQPKRRIRRSQRDELAGSEKLLFQLLDASAQDLYREIASSDLVKRLGAIGSVDIGTVTGDNKFFLVSERDAKKIGIEHFKLTISKAKHVDGSQLTTSDIDRMIASGERLWMFAPDPGASPRDLRRAKHYLRKGEEAGVPLRYKARIRDPWWAVPLPNEGTPPDLFLTYCSSEHPRMVANGVSALSTNTVHGVSLHRRRDRANLATIFPNSLTLLSAELVGRSYGGGVLKLEPSEAEDLLVPDVTGLGRRLAMTDRILRKRSLTSVLDLVDGPTLSDGLGLDDGQIALLRRSGERLRTRRRNRGRAPRL